MNPLDRVLSFGDDPVDQPLTPVDAIAEAHACFVVARQAEENATTHEEAVNARLNQRVALYAFRQAKRELAAMVPARRVALARR